jgi:hypothetical protein
MMAVGGQVDRLHSYTERFFGLENHVESQFLEDFCFEKMS